MGKAVNFNELWSAHQENRKTAAFAWSEKPDQSRCAFVLGLTLKAKFKPRAAELSFKEVAGLPKPLKGQPFMAKFYVKAADLAARLREEWGKPDLTATGADARKLLAGKQGVIFVENAWTTFRGGKIVDHVDLWNGERLGAYSTEETGPILDRADSVSLWMVPRIDLTSPQ